MSDFLFQIERSKTTSLQSQIREVLVSAILAGHLPTDKRIPSTRELAKTLKVSRNTVLLSYLGLVEDGYLLVRNRSGYYVNSEILDGRIEPPITNKNTRKSKFRWQSRFRVHPGAQRNINKPADWLDYPYPFIYGQIDHKLFPMAAWRECQRQTMGKRWLSMWTEDIRDQDDAALVEQIRKRLLPRRGIMAAPDEILVTLGAQNALYLLASLLVTPQTKIGFEEPGYPDARNIFALKTDSILPISVDNQGLVVDGRLDECDLVFTTPSHQFPTTATLSQERRKHLIRKAVEKDIIIIEDDYEFETNYMGDPTPALKSLDRNGNVIYIGSLSKSLFPGLRIGFLVAPPELIEEARALRRLMMRHPPRNNQRTTALFLSLGHHDALLHRLNRCYRRRWNEMGQALKTHLPNSSRLPSFGGSSYWVRGPARLNAVRLARSALKEGIIIEPGGIFFSAGRPPKNFFRLGFSSIESQHIEPGISKLATLIDAQLDT